MEHYITHTSSGLAMLDGIFIAGCVPPVIIAQDLGGGGRLRPLKRQSHGTFVDVNLRRLKHTGLQHTL
jgi:hypothetical protein